LSVKEIDVGAGVIDSSYRGEVKVLLINNSVEPYSVSKGDRIAQLVMERCSNAEVQVVESLDETQRGDGGFGSTGNNSFVYLPKKNIL
jgi:dUTP pyrophosphatase